MWGRGANSMNYSEFYPNSSGMLTVKQQVVIKRFILGFSLVTFFIAQKTAVSCGHKLKPPGNFSMLLHHQITGGAFLHILFQSRIQYRAVTSWPRLNIPENRFNLVYLCCYVMRFSELLRWILHLLHQRLLIHRSLRCQRKPSQRYPLQTLYCTHLREPKRSRSVPQELHR